MQFSDEHPTSIMRSVKYSLFVTHISNSPPIVWKTRNFALKMYSFTALSHARRAPFKPADYIKTFQRPPKPAGGAYGVGKGRQGKGKEVRKRRVGEER